MRQRTNRRALRGCAPRVRGLWCAPRFNSYRIPSLNTPAVAIANLLPCLRMDVAIRASVKEFPLTTA
ncbi:hypothetical protein C1922_19510 [Stenotrophomonas sp. ZAC14D2_NAIMI4_7]|nr:hypothetical protein C1922_19510 [Stenotrophomonas sp. ZAC14D2_NAIMI4_7]AWH30937.1 hypothetical protein C1931_19435 [Stenotrophomonas sp. YAU14A_MKIMI4_1]AWH34881.1 hypothetical protein C1930_19365 [Stenotrophomonas sp. SAU14A_NAIMI4_8]